jgi:glycosyltransferase involved in cell wall biosynthesis
MSPLARKPTTSVAIATYNGARFLAEQLASIARQSCAVDEVVISDDCSGDDSVQIAAEAAARLGLAVRVLNNTVRLGVASNFERAMRACKGEIIFLSDQDDIWYPNKVERVLGAFADNPHLLAVFSDAVVVDEVRRPLHDSLLALSRLTPAERDRIRVGGTFDVLMTRNVVAGATMALRASAVSRGLPIPPGWYHDEWLALFLSSFGDVGLIEEPLIEYRQHQANTIGAPRRTGLLEKYISLSRLSRAERLQAAERARRLVERFASSPDLRAPLQTRAIEKREHLRVRAELPKSKFRRLPAVVRELTNGHYFRYSHGIRAAARDLLQELD